MARIGQGTQLQYSTDGVSYTTIASLTEIGEVGLGEGDDIDVTTHQSADGFREFARGLVDGGEISFTGNWEGTTTQQVPITGSTGVLTGPTTVLDYFKVIFPASLGTWTARGYWKSFTINPNLDDTMEFSGSVKISGKPAFVIP